MGALEVDIFADANGDGGGLGGHGAAVEEVVDDVAAEDFFDVESGFAKGDFFDEFIGIEVAVVFEPDGDAVWAGVVACGGEHDVVFELLEELSEVPASHTDVDVGVVELSGGEGFEAEAVGDFASGGGHDLHETACTDPRAGAGAEVTFFAHDGPAKGEGDLEASAFADDEADEGAWVSQLEEALEVEGIAYTPQVQGVA